MSATYRPCPVRNRRSSLRVTGCPMPKRMAPSLPLLARSLRQGRREFEPETTPRNLTSSSRPRMPSSDFLTSRTRTFPECPEPFTFPAVSWVMLVVDCIELLQVRPDHFDLAMD